MKLYKCCDCGKIYHKEITKNGCYFCGSYISEEMVDRGYIANKKALYYYELGCKYLEKESFSQAKHNFMCALRYDNEFSTAYWFGYLAKNNVKSESKLIYNGGINKEDIDIKCALKYSKGSEKEYYTDVVKTHENILAKICINERKKIINELSEMKEKYVSVFHMMRTVNKSISLDKLELIELKNKYFENELEVRYKKCVPEWAQFVNYKLRFEELKKLPQSKFVANKDLGFEMMAVTMLYDVLDIEGAEGKIKKSLEYGRMKGITINKKNVEKRIEDKLKVLTSEKMKLSTIVDELMKICDKYYSLDVDKMNNKRNFSILNDKLSIKENMDILNK